MSLHRRRALLLSYLTVAYNLVEGVIAIAAGSWAWSIALIGFGMDSFVESLSGAVMIWRFTKHGKIPETEEIKIERKALKLVGYTFFVLAAYILITAIQKFFTQEMPQASLVGILIAIASLIAMPLLFYFKVKTARSLGSRSLIADARQTLACSMMSVTLLISLLLTSLYAFFFTCFICSII